MAQPVDMLEHNLAINSNVYVTDEEAFIYWLIYLIKLNADLLEHSDEIKKLEKCRNVL